MQTSFTLAQLADPDVAESEKILRACVHCGFCTATCPTYVLDGNELDSPRGRIYLIKDMLENDRPATAEVTLHIDRCLSCSGLHDDVSLWRALHAPRRPCPRPYREDLPAAGTRAAAAHRARKAFALSTAIPVGSCGGACRQAVCSARRSVRTQAACSHAAARPGAPSAQRHCAANFQAAGAKKGRVALLVGCVNDLLAPQINAAAIRVLTRLGIEVVVAEGSGCCGSLVHHMGREAEALSQARANIDAWTALGPLDAVVVTTSGCGTTVKDYGFMFRTDSTYAERAAKVAGLARDITEYLATLPIKSAQAAPGLVVAYHAACSLQHGQRVTRQPRELLGKLGFTVKDVRDGHLCCGSAGTYNILQPDIARRLRERKVRTIEELRPDVIAAGNIGCMTQIAAGTKLPAVHTIELIDWATGGPCPPSLREHGPQTAVRSNAAAS